MNGRIDQIGFSQRVRLEWLEETASLVRAGNERAVIKDAMETMLSDKVSIGGDAERGNRSKVVSILMTCWVTPPEGLETLSADGLRLITRLPTRSRVAVHWGMAMAAYPFWGSVAAQTGRLLRLQDSATAAQIQRRVREQYGERETAARACRRVLRSFLDWGVIVGSDDRGLYSQGPLLPIDDTDVVAWIVEATLRARSCRSSSLKDLLGSPSLFPFQIERVPAERLAAGSGRMAVVRLGLDEEMVTLCEGHEVGARAFARIS